MTIDNTAMDVIVSTVTAVVQEPTISTITATIKDNVVQIPFDVILQVKDFYEVCWSKLMWFVSVIGAISVLFLGYVGYFFPKDFKERLSKQEKTFDLYKKEQKEEFTRQIEEQKAEFARQIEEQKAEFAKQIEEQKNNFGNKIKKIKENSDINIAAIFGNNAILLDMIYRASNKEQDDYFIKSNCILLCSAITSLLKIGISIYEKDNMESLNKQLKTLNYILKEKNKNFIDKNLLKEVLDGLKNIDEDKINASLQDNIKNITKFYDTL